MARRRKSRKGSKHKAGKSRGNLPGRKGFKPSPAQKKRYYDNVTKATRRLVGVMKKHNPAKLHEIIRSA